MESGLFKDLVISIKEAQAIVNVKTESFRLFHIKNKNELDVDNSIQELKEALHKVRIQTEYN